LIGIFYSNWTNIARISESKRSHQSFGSDSSSMEYPLLSYEKFKRLEGVDQEQYFNSIARASRT
jgi:hypothetical protein